MSDWDNLQKEIQEKYTELERIEIGDFKTKISMIEKIVELERQLLLANKLPLNEKNEFSSYIWKKLEDRHISFSRDDEFYKLFFEEEKREYSGKSRNNNSPPLPEITQEEIDSVETKLTILENLRGREVSFIDNPQYHHNKNVEESCRHLTQLVKMINIEYNKAHTFTSNFEKFYDITKAKEELARLTPKDQRRLERLIKEYETAIMVKQTYDKTTKTDEDEAIREILVDIKKSKILVDERFTIRWWHRITAILAQITQSKNQTAKMLNVDKKHLTNNINPKENPVTGAPNKHYEWISWFDHVTVKNPNGEEYIVNFTEWFEEQILRQMHKLPFKKLVLAIARIN